MRSASRGVHDHAARFLVLSYRESSPNQRSPRGTTGGSDTENIIIGWYFYLRVKYSKKGNHRRPPHTPKRPHTRRPKRPNGPDPIHRVGSDGEHGGDRPVQGAGHRPQAQPDGCRDQEGVPKVGAEAAPRQAEGLGARASAAGVRPASEGVRHLTGPRGEGGAGEPRKGEAGDQETARVAGCEAQKDEGGSRAAGAGGGARQERGGGGQGTAAAGTREASQEFRDAKKGLRCRGRDGQRRRNQRRSR